jgi:hypothetical protein
MKPFKQPSSKREAELTASMVAISVFTLFLAC